MYTYTVSFKAYDEYGTSRLYGDFKSLHSGKPSPQEIKDAVNRILRSYNWSTASVSDIVVYRAS